MRKDRTPWSTSAMNALELLVNAGWPMAAIAAHCSGIDGVTRSRGAATDKANALGLKSARGYGRYPAIGDRYDADIADLMMFDRTAPEIAEMLTAQFGHPVSVSAVKRRMQHMPPGLLSSYRKRETKRRSRVVAQGRWRAAQRRIAA